MLHFEKSVQTPVVDVKTFQKIYWEVLVDNPLLFYVENTMYYFNAKEARVEYQYAYKWEECIPIYRKIFSEISDVKKACEGFSEKKKEEYIHDYIATQVKYDKNEALPIHRGNCFFMHRKAVCDGIAKATKILLDSVGMKSMLVHGESIKQSTAADLGEKHAWNMVWINQIPFHLDVTWNLRTDEKWNVIRRDYYNLSDDQIRRDHDFDFFGINAVDASDWFRENNMYFTKKSLLKEHVKNGMKRKESCICFKLPFTMDSHKTIAEIEALVHQEIAANVLWPIKYWKSVNENQMVVYLYFVRK